MKYSGKESEIVMPSYISYSGKNYPVTMINPDMREGLKLPLPVVKPCAYLSDANLVGALYHHLHEN